MSNISLSIHKNEKIALIGHNGSGKSTLLKLLAGKLMLTDGEIKLNANPYYIPQIFGQYNHLSVAEALNVAEKINALHQILEGNANETNMDSVGDDWSIEERCREALDQWDLHSISLNNKMANLSGGQKTKVFLAGLDIHKPELVLMDEPSNHLDNASRKLLYQWIDSCKCSLLIVSHDRYLLNLFPKIHELTSAGILVYGGNYDFYQEQKSLARQALNQDIHSKEKALKKAKEKERETAERQQRLDARGKKKQEKAGVARIMINTLRNNAENSTSKLKGIHTEKIENLTAGLTDLRASIPDADQMKFGFNPPSLHRGKIVVKLSEVNFSYNEIKLWTENINQIIYSGSRLTLKGNNGSGKTTLIKLILGDLPVESGEIFRATQKAIYIDQEYSFINNELSVYEQAQKFNAAGLFEHEIKTRLNRFLFGKEDWDKPCNALSGGEKMRLSLCCLTIAEQTPDILILDEPTNNLDIQNIEILTAAINEYQGTLIVVSHDIQFLSEINIESEIWIG
ncbi:ABC-F family ATP-binding cassette domain-containing protein [Pedobacter sp. AW1-32]|uniref:ABC-F family ATP-binding cassette domain-containing protein n=1 Tax=Pedobacter sp. AW1-32 TaxID=3383026 RepID=UPI003FF0221D